MDNIVPPNLPIDITQSVVTLDNMILQSTGILSTAKFTINSEFGEFTSDINFPATKPIIEQFDRIRITVIDDNGVPKDNKIFEVVTNLSQLATQSSHFLPLELEGRERNLSGIPFGGFFRNSTHKQLALDILLAYGRQNGTKQPIISFDINDLPDFNPNFWDFTQVDNCYDALMTIIEHANLPVSAGGGGNRFAIIFEDDAVFPADILRIKIIQQGTNNLAPFPVLTQNTDNPITKIDKTKQASTGSVSVVRGRPKTGTQPSNFSEFVGRLEFYRNIKQFDNTIDYPQGVHIRFGGLKYQANVDVAAGNPPPFGGWTQIDVGDFIGVFQYSPFTDGKATGPIKNGFANPTGAFNPNLFTSVAVPDHNLVIRDTNTTREWALIRSNTTLITGDAFLNKYMTNFGAQRDFVEGTTILVDTSLGAVGGDFAADNFGTGAGNDPNGISYANNIAVFRIPPNSAASLGIWIVQHQTQEFDQCALYSEGIIFEFNVASNAGDRIYPGNDRRRGGSIAGSFAWRDISGYFMSNDCFHSPLSIEIVDGLFGDKIQSEEPLNDPLGIPYVRDSAVKITYGHPQSVQRPEEQDVWFKLFNIVKTVALGNIGAFLVNLTAATFATFTTPNYTNLGWWFAWPSPYPLSTHNAIAEEIGQLYGGDVNTLNRHRYFDMFNIRYTTTGKEGWVHSDSKDLSEITGVKFLFNFDMTIDGTRIPFEGDVPFSYWVMDDAGTIWKSQKVIYRHLGETQTINIEFGDLSPVFRGRTPLGLSNVIDQIIIPEIEVNEVMFKDRIIMQGFQCEIPYDKNGRYSPNLFEQLIKPIFFNAFSGGGGTVKFEGTIDAYNFVKTPIAISAPSTFSGERTIIPNFLDFQNIVNVEQLQRFSDAQLDIEEFQFEQYIVEQGGIADLNLEDTVTLNDIIVKESEVGPNTRNLALREIHYSDMKDRGLIRKVVLVRPVS